MTLGEFLQWAEKKLKESHIENGADEARWMIRGLEGYTSAKLITQREKELNPEAEKALKEAVQKRSENYPLQYILGHTDFMGLNFLVKEGVLIPRPETELLVNQALKKLPENANVLEIGAGSGCISVSLKHYRPDLQITAADISQKALEVTAENAKRILGSAEEITILHSDCFESIAKQTFDAILSNPPYLTGKDMENLQPELRYEPEIALSPGETGLTIYEEIARRGKEHLKPGGFIALEIGYNIYRQVLEVFSRYQLIETTRDNQGIVRVLVFTF
jgi:release factor glutamine methyltransferase